MKKSGLSHLELLVIIALLVVSGLLVLSWGTFVSFDRAARASCANNLKQIGIALKMYSNESRGEKYPPPGFYHEFPVDCDGEGYPILDEKRPVLTNFLNVPSIYPEYISEPQLFVCPADPTLNEKSQDNLMTTALEVDRICSQSMRGVTQAGQSYTYLAFLFDDHYLARPTVSHLSIGKLRDLCGPYGFEIPIQHGLYANLNYSEKSLNPDQLLVTLDRDIDLRAQLATFGASELAGHEFVGNGGTDWLLRIREGVSRFVITDIGNAGAGAKADARIPLMFGNVSARSDNWHHGSPGTNVLYLDGHVEFKRYSDGEFPTNVPFAHLMTSVSEHPTYFSR